MATVHHTDRLQALVGRTPSAATEAYQQARYRARTSRDAADRDLYEDVALAIASTAAMSGVVLDY